MGLGISRSTYVQSMCVTASGRVLASLTEFRGPTWVAGSDDDGSTWDFLFSSGRWFRQMVQGPNSLFSIDEVGQLYRSANDGATWTPRGSLSLNSLAIDRDGRIYGCNGTGVFVSSDEGTSWVDISHDLPQVFGITLMVSPEEDLYLGTLDRGVWKTSQPITFLHQPSNEVPTEFSLRQNYPNPFNPRTTISFQLTAVSQTTLTIYDLLGREVATLVRDKLAPGTYRREWDATGYPSGVYFYRLQAGDPSTSSGNYFTETRKLVLVR